jgi:hypothetical protein
MARIVTVLIGLAAISIFGLAVLNVLYQSGPAPVVFIVWIFLPFALFGVLLNVLLKWDLLWLFILMSCTIFAASFMAVGGFRPAFWFVIVPASGLVAATIPHDWRVAHYQPPTHATRDDSS